MDPSVVIQSKSWLGFALLAATVVVHLAFAGGVLTLASEFRRRFEASTEIVGPAMWTIATLFGGPIVAGIFWLVHFTALREPRPRPPASGAGEHP